MRIEVLLLILKIIKLPITKLKMLIVKDSLSINKSCSTTGLVKPSEETSNTLKFFVNMDLPNFEMAQAK
jgi:hypothetical protein